MTDNDDLLLSELHMLRTRARILCHQSEIVTYLRVHSARHRIGIELDLAMTFIWMAATTVDSSKRARCQSVAQLCIDGATRNLDVVANRGGGEEFLYTRKRSVEVALRGLGQKQGI
jgi:hypothetical protein